MAQTKIIQDSVTIEATTGNGGRLMQVTVSTSDPQGLEHWPQVDLVQVHSLFGVNPNLNGHSVAAPLTGDSEPVTSKRTAKKAPAKAARTTPKAKPANKSNTADTTETTGAVKTERVYNRLSDENEKKIIDAWEMEQPRPPVRILAERFSVKQHTMQGWVNRLKAQGKIAK